MGDTQRLQYLVNHVFMPPKVPQEDDYNAKNDGELCGTVLKCAEDYVRHLPAEKHFLWNRVARILRRLRDLHASNFNSQTLKSLLSEMVSGGDSLSFHSIFINPLFRHICCACTGPECRNRVPDARVSSVATISNHFSFRPVLVRRSSLNALRSRLQTKRFWNAQENFCVHSRVPLSLSLEHSSRMAVSLPSSPPFCRK